VYRSNSGSSDYLALNVIARYRSSRGVFQAAYTYSHSTDNQSDPLLGESIGANFNKNLSSTTAGIAAFTTQCSGDYASSDFDQRHNFVFYSLFSLPGPENGILKQLFGGWEVAQLGAFRSGFPFSVLAPSGLNALLNNRADYLGGNVNESTPVAEANSF
jgi:hypothetical protein